MCVYIIFKQIPTMPAGIWYGHQFLKLIHESKTKLTGHSRCGEPFVRPDSPDKFGRQPLSIQHSKQGWTLCSAEHSKNSTASTNAFYLAENPAEKQKLLSFPACSNSLSNYCQGPNSSWYSLDLQSTLSSHFAEGIWSMCKNAVSFCFKGNLKID